MKELGEYLKEQRIANGVGVEEAATDLGFSSDDIENIESGNIRAFRDVLQLKENVKTYAKYLGLDPEKVVDEFNDFLFEHTSKISLNDILEAKKKIEEKDEVHSPYTIEKKKKINIDSILKLKPLFIALLIIIVLLLIVFIYMEVIKENSKEKRTTELVGDRSEIYEFAK